MNHFLQQMSGDFLCSRMDKTIMTSFIEKIRGLSSWAYLEKIMGNETPIVSLYIGHSFLICIAMLL